MDLTPYIGMKIKLGVERGGTEVWHYTCLIITADKESVTFRDKENKLNIVRAERIAYAEIIGGDEHG